MYDPRIIEKACILRVQNPYVCSFSLSIFLLLAVAHKCLVCKENRGCVDSFLTSVM